MYLLQGYGEKKHAYIAAQGVCVCVCVCVCMCVRVCVCVCVCVYCMQPNTTCIVHAFSGPVTQSVEQFWRMVWEYQLETIVMLTKCVEGGKVSESPKIMPLIV